MTGYAARRTPVHRGPAAWSAILPKQPAPVVLETDMVVDVAVIGAGFAGLSAARRLRQLDRSVSVTVLDAGPLAEGASGRNSGFMIDLPHEITSEDYVGQCNDQAIISLNRAAIGFAGDAVADYDINTAYFERAGKINGAASMKADSLNRAYARHLDTLGEPSEFLDAQAMTEVTGSRYYLSGLYTPGTVMLQPAGYIRGLGEGLRRDGVKVYENTPAIAIERQGKDWVIITQRGRVMAGKVIMAINGQLESFGFARRRLMHVFLYASMTADLSPDALAAIGGQSRWGITPSDPMGTTMRRIDTPLGGNRIVTRTCATFEPGMEPAEATLRRTLAVHAKKFADRFPTLASVRQEFTWAGHLCLSRNGVSIARELEPGLYAATVCNGLGATRSTLTGIAAADCALGRPTAFSDHFAEEAEPSLLPPVVSSISANLFLRWKEWRARLE